MLLQVFYSVRSERQLMEQTQYNLLFRWFIGLSMDDAVWVPKRNALPEKLLFLSSATLRKYLSGGEIGVKFNTIQARIFREQPWLTEQEFINELQRWLGVGDV